MILRESNWLDGTRAGATFSDDERHRFALWRRRSSGVMTRAVTFVMLNPSTATHEVSDPTVRRCEAFAERWNFDDLTVVNLFSLRSTDPAALYKTPDADGGAMNDRNITSAAYFSDVVVCAWGAHGKYQRRAEQVLDLLALYTQKIKCLGLTKGGHPKHPLYLRSDSQLLPFNPEREAA